MRLLGSGRVALRSHRDRHGSKRRWPAEYSLRHVEARQISNVTTTRVLMSRPGLPALFIAAAFLPADAGLRIGDRVILGAEPGSATGDTVRIAAIVKRRADPAEVARSEYRIR